MVALIFYRGASAPGAPLFPTLMYLSQLVTIPLKNNCLEQQVLSSLVTVMISKIKKFKKTVKVQIVESIFNIILNRHSNNL